MVGEGDAVVDAEHQEEHGAADKQIPSMRPAQMRRLESSHANRCGDGEQAEAPDRFTEESFPPPPPSAPPQLAQRWRTNQAEVASAPASSKKLLVKNSSHDHETKEQGRNQQSGVSRSPSQDGSVCLNENYCGSSAVRPPPRIRFCTRSCKNLLSSCGRRKQPRPLLPPGGQGGKKLCICI